MPVTLISHPDRGLWNRTVTPEKGDDGNSPEPVTKPDGQSKIETWQIRHGISDAAKARAQRYINEANARSFAPRRLPAQTQAQNDAREQALNFIALRKAGRRRG